MPDDPYTDPATGVLRNKLGLSTAAELEAAEREITHAALILLRETPVRATYDLPHLCAVHRRIFGDIYDWAGQVRSVAIAKGSLFCLPRYIEPSAAEIFCQLRDENFLQSLERDAFIDRLACYLGEVRVYACLAAPRRRPQHRDLCRDHARRRGPHAQDARRTRPRTLTRSSRTQVPSLVTTLT